MTSTRQYGKSFLSKHGVGSKEARNPAPEIPIVKTSIEDMKVGQSGYITPWSVLINEEKQLFVRKNLQASDLSRGTVSLRITKQEDGIHIDSSTLDPKGIEVFQSVDTLDLSEYLPAIIEKKTASLVRKALHFLIR